MAFPAERPRFKGDIKFVKSLPLKYDKSGLKMEPLGFSGTQKFIKSLNLLTIFSCRTWSV